MEDIKNLTREDIDQLLSSPASAPAVTLYMPTHRTAAPPHMSEDEIRFKNLRSQALDIIRSRSDKDGLEAEFKNETDKLLDNPAFWEHQTDGLLLCARPGDFRLFHLPIETEEYVSVSDQYHLAPIFGLIRELGEYYVLAIAQHRPALYKGDWFSLNPTDLILPETLKDGLNIDEMGRENEQQRSANGGGFNGRGGDKNPAEDERQRFWRLLDQRVLKFTGNQQQPLILAGIASEVSEYRSASNYPDVMDEHIEGSFGGENAHQLFPLALTIYRSHVSTKQDSAVEEYRRLSGQEPDLTAFDFAAIIDGANRGRVDKLLIPGVKNTRDTVKEDLGQSTVINFPPEESAQAVNEVARIVWNASGEVINVEAEHMPKSNSQMLAIFRY